MRLRGIFSVLLVGGLVLVLAVGAALAAQQEETGGDDPAGEGSANAENGDGRNDGGLTLELEGRPKAADGYVDLGQQGVTRGDLFVFSDELYGTAEGQGDGQGSGRIGQADGRCTVVDPASQRLMCTVVSSFENGTIVTEGVMANDDASSASSVTGGTGEYRGVTGEATVDLTPAEGPHELRFDLQRDDTTSRAEPDPSGRQEEGAQEQTEARTSERTSQEGT